MTDEMKILLGFLGKKSHQRNITVEMCSDEFFVKHVLPLIHACVHPSHTYMHTYIHTYISYMHQIVSTEPSSQIRIPTRSIELIYKTVSSDITGGPIRENRFGIQSKELTFAIDWMNLFCRWYKLEASSRPKRLRFLILRIKSHDIKKM